MNRLIANTLIYALMVLLSIPAMAQNPATKPAPNVADSNSNRSPNPATASRVVVNRDGEQWIGTWATAPQPFIPGSLQTFRNQSLRLIVHTSAGGTKVRIKISNTYGDGPLLIGGAHIARRTAAAEIDPRSDRMLKFQTKSSTTVAAGLMVVSDPVEMDVPALSDLAVSLFLPQRTEAKTSHSMAKQTSYVSPATGDSTAAVNFPVAKTIHSWPFLTGVDVEASSGAAAIVAFGSSLTDGDGTTADTNGRWPDVLAERLQKGAGGKAEIGVLNEGIIGNRLLHDSPKGADNPFGAGLGQAGLARFERDVLAQAGVRYVIVGLGINDILFPAFPFTPPKEKVSAEDIISGYRQLVARGHRNGVRVIATTNPPFENSAFEGWLPLFILPRGKPYVKRLTTGFAAVVNSMAWSISIRSCVTQAIPRDCFLHMTAETTCIPITRVALPRGMPFPLRCSRTIKLMASCLDSRY